MYLNTGCYINTDASVTCQSGPGKLGGVFRDHEGSWTLGYTKDLLHVDAHEVELLAILEGLRITLSRNLFPLEINSDSTTAINMIQTNHLGFCNIIYECRKLNKIADALAKSRGREPHFGQLQLLTVPPLFIHDLLEADKSGTTYPRRVISNHVTTREDEEPLLPRSAKSDEVPQPKEGEGPQPKEGEGPQPKEGEGSQPKEAVETVNDGENQQPEDPQTYRFTWKIENFSRINVKKLYSRPFAVGGYNWRILIFPDGNNVDDLSMYLDAADSATLPYGWSRYSQFSLSVVDQIQNTYSIRRETQHLFNARDSDWGFTSFMPLAELYDQKRGYLVDGMCIIQAEVSVGKLVGYLSYYSKKETGFVGLQNQGATCYMNSLLQTLYHIPYFRKAVYRMPTMENDMPSASIPLALQSLFYKLQYSDNSVATKELTKSFGWNSYDSFMQHDVQELNRVLCEKLEEKMKGTAVEGTIQELFEGCIMNYIECINVDYKSTREESFYDLQLDVKGCSDVYASFDKYVEVECLDGDNKYHAEQHGLQDAKKGALFINFPPVLQLHLKRFEYDSTRHATKINDLYEFPLQLDLDRENGKYLSPEADKSVRNLYKLHRYKFDDAIVTKEDAKRVLEEHGVEEELPQTNAYMLVYIRESDKEKIMCTVDQKDIAEHLRARSKREQEDKEQKKKEKSEAHLYTIIKVAHDEDLRRQIGKDIYFDLVDFEKVKSFRIQKQTLFTVFKKILGSFYDNWGSEEGPDHKGLLYSLTVHFYQRRLTTRVLPAPDHKGFTRGA
ncbi:Ubiquitin carboxyl-terminal hydrolase 12 [Capsicum annuum]|nr:Ubiquitin carboxyl-terminal hydrolase 12 [Capsicum annuum]